MELSNRSVVVEALEAHLQVVREVVALLVSTVGEIGELLASVIAGGGTVYWCGNGGSAADSQHLSAELIGRFSTDRRPLRSVALTTDSSVLTCISNDFGFESVFSRQVEALLGPRDVLVALSTTGESENVLGALRIAKKNGASTVAMLGKGGGAAAEIAEHVLIVGSDETARIQETHILIGHILCEIIERELGLD